MTVSDGTGTAPDWLASQREPGLAQTPPARSGLMLAWLARRSERLILSLAALLAGFGAFAIFLLVLGKSPADYFSLVWRAGFGTAFSWENTASRAAPLLLAALCVALPARLGLVIIGGEGAIVLGGLAAGALGALLHGTPVWIALFAMALAAGIAGGGWIGAVGWMRVSRGVNETIASLLMAYIAIALLNHFVEGPLRDPASLNKPSTAPIDAAHRIGQLPGFDVHWGLVAGILACLLAWVVVDFTRVGFAARVIGANPRAARVQALPVGPLVVAACVAGGALAGLAGFFEVAAVHGSANGSLNAGFGYTAILIAFLARHHPLAIVPVAFLLAGFEAAGGLVQRRMGLPDATVLVLQGFVFIAILASETLVGRFKAFAPERWRGAA